MIRFAPSALLLVILEVLKQEFVNAVSTGPSMADTAWGRVTAGTQLLTKGGFEGVFKSTFTADADEKLKKTYACFLSTSTGPVAGTLYISTKKIAFCSDRALSYTPQGGQTAYSYYKVNSRCHTSTLIPPYTVLTLTKSAI